MKASVVLCVGSLLLLAGLVMACGEGDGDDDEPVDGTTTPLATTEGTQEDPHSEFQAARDRVMTRLDAFGANIGSVPDDVRDQLLAECLELQDFADPGEVEQVCGGIGQAIDGNDPGLVDLILDRLAELEPS